MTPRQSMGWSSGPARGQLWTNTLRPSVCCSAPPPSARPAAELKVDLAAPSSVCDASACDCAAQDRERVMPLMIQGFRDAAEEGGTSVTGGQTVINPWIIIGGVATVVCQPNEFIM